MAKRGPKNKVGDPEKVKALAILSTGASLKDAADYLEIGYNTLLRARKEDPKFGSGVLKALKDAKIRLIKKIGKASAWQAAAWMLERRYGREYGRREIVRQEITGKDGGAIKTESTQTIVTDLAECSRRFEEYTRRQLGTGPVPADRN